MVIKTAIDYIAKNEGFEEYVYDDIMGIPTIGYGFNLKTTPLPEDLAKEWLRRLVNEAYIQVEKQYSYFAKLTPQRQVALIDLMFNLGPAGLAKFKKFHEAMVAGEYTRAADELMDSLYAKQVTNRAKRNKDLIVNG